MTTLILALIAMIILSKVLKSPEPQARPIPVPVKRQRNKKK
jgi:hypothetical protein